MTKIVLASSNPGKIAEFQAMLPSVTLISQASLGIDSVEETGLSFVENALLKARHASRLSGLPALADDSGLMVDALNGQPGVYSARFAGPNASDQDNIQLLLNKLFTIPASQRQASFVCALALVQHGDDPCPTLAVGRCRGEISSKAQGREGFGYDPVFFLPEQGGTMAQLPASLKNTLSHRAKALNLLRDQLL